MNIKIIKYFGVFLLIAVFSALSLRAEGVGGKKAEVLNRTFGEPANTHFNINLISTWLYNDARSDISQAGNSGFIYPKGSNKAVFYQSGFIWGGKVQGEVRVGGTAYRTGVLPGRVVNGVPTSPDAADARIYRVRPDYADADLSTEVTDGDGVSEDAVRAQYELDWNEWPADQGAPFEDVDGDGVYDPTVDIPGVPGADQTIWHVCNDFDPGQADYLYGSLPMGVEVQYTYWGYNTTGALGSTMFRKYLIINKNPDGLDFTDMYVSMWSDPDLGDAGDDFVGCDTTTSLGFVYNAGAYDAQYEYTPPAGGFDFFQGPIIDGLPTDEAIYKGAKVQGKINLPMSAFYFFINSDAVYTDPRQGEARGTTEFYNLFEGKISTTGVPFQDPDGNVTKFTLSGDPIARTGWIDGMLHPPGDRRMGQVAGPFTMAFGDTQEIVVAQIAAGAQPGVDRLGALGMLKFYDLAAQLTYDNFFNVATAPKAPVVEVTELDREIILDWSGDRDVVAETEGHDELGFTFQGYNVYQLPSASATIAEATRIATYDVIDFINKIEGLQFDATTGVVATKVLQFGTDSGIQRYIDITTDALKSNIPLVNGQRYYFAVTAYAFNPDPEAVPNQLENPISIMMVVPHAMDPGNRIYSEFNADGSAEHASGSANAAVNWKVVDPTKVTGDDYEVFFDQQHYYMDVDGKWKKTNYPDQVGKRGVNDNGQCYLTASMKTSPTPGTADIIFVVEGVENSPDYNYVDGVEIVFPPSVVIHDVSNTSSDGAYGQAGNSVDVTTNTVLVGSKDRTGYGPFHGGGETITVNVNVPALPLTVSYTIYDDGWAESDPAYAAYAALGGGIVDATGTVTITEMGYAFKTESHWNVRNVTTNEVVIDDQTVIGGAGFYDGQDYGNWTAPTAEGIQVWMENGSYDLPLWQYNNHATGNQGGSIDLRDETQGDYWINDYALSGWAANAWAVNTFVTGDAFGTTSIDELQQDYELRFTGEYEDPNADIRYIKPGTGQNALLVNFNSTANLANHPMNPNPGSTDPFWIRIPFEIWNVDTDTQVNLIVRDRIRTDASTLPFDAWNRDDRMYAWILNTPYDDNAAPPDIHDATAMEHLTWNLVFWQTDWVKDDVLDLIYANPIQLGVDTYTFTSPDPASYDADLAVEDIQNDLNVFPNPYYGVNSQEINKYQRFVTFTHLPQNATIRIFNLAGQLVRTIEKTDEGQFQRWDLMNQGGLPVASGLYIAYVDMPDLGTTKVLKVAIIQEQQILDRF